MSRHCRTGCVDFSSGIPIQPCTVDVSGLCTVQVADPVRIMFTLQPDSPTPLVTQIVDGLRRLIVDGSLRTGAKIPSIRQFAKTHQVSVFTVVEAYDRLVAQGYLVSRPHSGFFVRRRARWIVLADAGEERRHRERRGRFARADARRGCRNTARSLPTVDMRTELGC